MVNSTGAVRKGEGENVAEEWVVVEEKVWWKGGCGGGREGVVEGRVWKKGRCGGKEGVVEVWWRGGYGERGDDDKKDIGFLVTS